jgi:hypothetical protein
MEYAIPEKLNEAVEKLSAIADKLTKLSAEDELKLAIKSRDDVILALQTQIKTLSKPEPIVDEGKPKTIQESTTEEKAESSFRVERGTVYFER